MDLWENVTTAEAEPHLSPQDSCFQTSTWGNSVATLFSGEWHPQKSLTAMTGLGWGPLLPAVFNGGEGTGCRTNWTISLAPRIQQMTHYNSDVYTNLLITWASEMIVHELHLAHWGWVWLIPTGIALPRVKFPRGGGGLDLSFFSLNGHKRSPWILPLSTSSKDSWVRQEGPPQLSFYYTFHHSIGIMYNFIILKVGNRCLCLCMFPMTCQERAPLFSSTNYPCLLFWWFSFSFQKCWPHMNTNVKVSFDLQELKMIH